MSNMKRRIEKVEGKVQSIKKEAENREAKLLEIQHLGKDDPVRSLLLKMELKYGRKCTWVDLVMVAHGRQAKELRRV